MLISAPNLFGVPLMLQFMHALSFNADISSWNVSSVEKAPMTFYAASSFRTDLSGWDVSHMKDVTKMVRVTAHCMLSAFNYCVAFH